MKTFPETSVKVYVWCMGFILNLCCAMPLTLENMGKITAKIGLKSEAAPTVTFSGVSEKHWFQWLPFTLYWHWKPHFVLRLCKM